MLVESGNPPPGGKKGGFGAAWAPPPLGCADGQSEETRRRHHPTWQPRRSSRQEAAVPSPQEQQASRVDLRRPALPGIEIEHLQTVSPGTSVNLQIGAEPLDESVLDNAVWHSLAGPHAEFAEREGQAARYDPDVSIFGALGDDGAVGWRDFGAVVGASGVAVLFRAELPQLPAAWTRLDGGRGHQMVLRDDGPVAAADDVTGVRPLGPDDVGEMLALVELTRPGPFSVRTVELGGYVGAFDDDRLVAMAGQRLAPPGFREIDRGVHASRLPRPRSRRRARPRWSHARSSPAASGRSSTTPPTTTPHAGCTSRSASGSVARSCTPRSGRPEPASVSRGAARRSRPPLRLQAPRRAHDGRPCHRAARWRGGWR